MRAGPTTRPFSALLPAALTGLSPSAPHADIWNPCLTTESTECTLRQSYDEEVLMTCRRTRCWWRLCPGCGRERRLARDRRVMCQHNRWDSLVWAMVPCQGSGQEPVSDDATGGANSAP